MSFLRQSALTDFLASRNISARQIEADFQARREALARQVQEQQQQNGDSDNALTTPTTRRTSARIANTSLVESSPASESGAASPATNGASSKKSAEQKKVLDKIKQNKKNKKRKSFDSDDDEEITQALMQNFGTPMPGQIENCAQCGKRFTVTPYSRADASGKLLCNPCGKLLNKDDEGQKNKKKPRPAADGPVGQRRKVQSRILDGASPLGAKPLVTLCVEHLSKNIHLAEDLGDLPEVMVDRIARILSKRRLLNPKTVDLFIRPDADSVCIYDAGDLMSGDFLRLLQAMPQLKSIKVYNGIQFKDEVMEYLISRDIALEAFCLSGANLLTEERWKEFLVEKGQHLRTLQICDTDKHVTDDVLSYIAESAPNVTRLKLNGDQRVTGVGISKICEMQHLEHVGLTVGGAGQGNNLSNNKSIHADVLVKLLLRAGGKLQTLSLRRATGADNSVLLAMHQHCRQLRKLRLTDSDLVTDAGFVHLFGDWTNPPLQVIDLAKNRHDDADSPRDNEDGVGLCSAGFEALMAHSGPELRLLNIESCRHISASSFEAVFAADKTYLQLERIEASFCEELTDHIVSCMFRSCPRLREVVTFGCMRVTGTKVPLGKIVVGVPNAQGMQTVGHDEE